MAGNLVPTNIMDVANYVQQQGDLGRQQGLAQKFNRLAGQAYTAPAGEQRTALLGQAVGVDPAAGMKLGDQLQSMDVDHNARLGGAARYMAQALQSKNPAQIDGAWRNVRPYLEKLTGKTPPDHWDPSMEAGLYQAIAATGGADSKKDLINVGAGGAVFDPATRQLIYQNPGVEKPANLQVVQIPDGKGGTIQGFADPRTGQIMPANYGMPAAQQPSTGRGSFVPIAEQANALLDQGKSPEDAVRQLLQARPDMQFQVKLDPQTGRFVDVSDGREQTPQGIPATGGGLGYSPPKPSAADQATWSAPVTEADASGKPIRVQYSNRGERQVVPGAAPLPAGAGKKSDETQKTELYTRGLADDALAYASAATGMSQDQLRTMTPEQVRAKLQKGSRWTSGPVVGRIPGMSAVANPDLAAYANAATGKMARMNNPTGPVSNADFDVAAKSIWGPDKPDAVNADLIYNALERAQRLGSDAGTAQGAAAAQSPASGGWSIQKVQ